MAPSDCIAVALHVVLVRPEIPWNTGNVGRTCLATGARLHLVAPLGFSLTERAVRRAGLDYWPRVQPCLWPDLTSLEERLDELGEPFLFSPEGERDLWDVPFPAASALLFGAESCGLPRPLRRRFRDRLVRIPVERSAVRSLNLSTAVALALYEVLRRHRPPAASAPS